MRITSLFSPFNWIKFLINPKKGFNVINKIIIDYPRIQNFLKIKNKSSRKFVYKFFTYIVGKNNSLNFFFLKNNEKIDKINFDVNDLKNDKNMVFQSLAYNGIIFIENALDIIEKEKILSSFEEIKKNNLTSEWIDNNIINASEVKYKNNKMVNISYAKKDLKILPQLENISKTITSKVFGKAVNSYAEFFLHESIEKESKDSFDDTVFHMDRYLPCLKVIYSPEKIDNCDGPFGFIKKTHKLNNSFIKDFLYETNTSIIDENKLSNLINKDSIKATCKPNTIIIVFTNGLHKRNIFLKKNILRKTIFLQYTQNFNKLSLFNFRKFNKNFIKSL